MDKDKITLRWKCYELYDSAESKWALLLTTITTIIFSLMTQEELNHVVLNIITLLVPPFVITIGLLLISLLLLVPIINDNLLQTVEQEGKHFALKGILFSFYFNAVVIGFAIVMMLISYILIHISTVTVFYVYIFFLSYFVWFSILYVIGLLKTIIQIYEIIRIVRKGEKE